MEDAITFRFEDAGCFLMPLLGGEWGSGESTGVRY